MANLISAMQKKNISVYQIRDSQMKPLYRRVYELNHFFEKMTIAIIFCLKIVNKNRIFIPKPIGERILNMNALNALIENIPNILKNFVVKSDNLDLKIGIEYFLRQYGIHETEIRQLVFKENIPQLTKKQCYKIYEMMCEDHGKKETIKAISCSENTLFFKGIITEDFIKVWDFFKIIPTTILIYFSMSHIKIDKSNLFLLPRNIIEHKELTDLIIEDSNLFALPKDICSLTKLSNLNLFSNKLSDLPSQIKQLQNLTNLSISNNPFKNLPDGLFLLTNLKYLKLNSLNLNELSKDIANLKKLEFLELNFCQFNLFPVIIAELPNLKYVSMHKSGFNELPKNIKNYELLKKIVEINY